MSTPLTLGFTLLVVTSAIGCGDVTAASCGAGVFCPEGTACGASARCVVELDRCSDFAVNAPCALDADELGFCVAGTCTASINIEGQVLQVTGDDVLDASVVALARPWMDRVDIPIGTFVVPAVPQDSALTLRFESDILMPMLTRPLILGGEDFVVNEDPNEPLRMIHPDGQVFFVERIGETFDAQNGAAAVRMTRSNGANLPRAQVSLVGGAGAPTPLYFASGNSGDPGATETSSDSGLVVFPNVPPGTYTFVFEHPMPRTCQAAGDPEPLTIEIVVEAGTLTDAGRVTCAQD